MAYKAISVSCQSGYVSYTELSAEFLLNLDFEFTDTSQTVCCAERMRVLFDNEGVVVRDTLLECWRKLVQSNIYRYDTKQTLSVDNPQTLQLIEQIEHRLNRRQTIFYFNFILSNIYGQI